MLSYLIAGLVAMIAALCYAEFGSEVAYTGGSFVYCSKIYGRAIGWFVAANLMLEYILAMATVAKGFTNYFASLIDVDLDRMQFCVANCESSEGFITLDPVALALVVVLTVALCFGVKESFYFNAATVVISIAVILLCIGLGATKVDNDNFTRQGFAPFGIKGVFTGASSVFFAYVGFDMVANAAEEAKNPKRDVPLAVVLAMVLCTSFYVAMSTVLVGMIPYDLLDINAAFSQAMKTVGYKWASYLVAIGAVCGVVNSCFADVFSLSRLLVILGRAEFVPSILTQVHPKTETPVVATLVTGLIGGILAFFVPLVVLADLVSLGTLAAFALVSMGVVFRSRYQPDGPTPLWKVVIPSVLVIFSGLACGVAYYYDDNNRNWPYYIAFGGLWLVSTLSFYLLPKLYTPASYRAPLNPILPCFGAGSQVFLIATLGPSTWQPWGYAMLAALFIYVVNGVHLYYNRWKDIARDIERQPVDKYPCSLEQLTEGRSPSM